MLVSDLIKFRDIFLSKIKLLDDQALLHYIGILNSIITENPNVEKFLAHEKVLNAISEYNQLINTSSQIIKPLYTVIDDINSDVDNLADKIMSTDYMMPYNHYFTNGENCSYLKFSQSDDINVAVKSSLHRYADFHFPGMQLGCRYSGEDIIYTTQLVANDPLYLCDFNFELISQASAHFNDIYNMRLRKYIINDHNFRQLPHNQFGFIFSWMFFNFAKFDILKEYLKNLFSLLRPGGTLMFSYNNCDLVESAMVFEQGFMSYVPKRRLLDLCDQLGYEISKYEDLPNNDTRIKYISWIEIKKPGALTTTKKSQAMGRILTK